MDTKVRALSRKRLKVLEAFIPKSGWLLDYGAGTFRFVDAAAEANWQVLGFDIVTRKHWHQCSETGLQGVSWGVVTFFDSLEHLVDPSGTIQHLNPQWIMISVPWCHHPEDPNWFMAWKHRRPGEHLWAWTRDGLDSFMRNLSYHPIMHSSFEDKYRPNPQQLESNILTAIYKKG